MCAGPPPRAPGAAARWHNGTGPGGRNPGPCADDLHLRIRRMAYAVGGSCERKYPKRTLRGRPLGLPLRTPFLRGSLIRFVGYGFPARTAFDAGAPSCAAAGVCSLKRMMAYCSAPSWVPYTGWCGWVSAPLQGSALSQRLRPLGAVRMRILPMSRRWLPRRQ